MEDFRTILDLFVYVHEKNMCTNPYCTTCGAMAYRNYCKSLGFTAIKELIETTTEKDFLCFMKENPFADWVEPLKTLLHDGFSADPHCYMMKIYDDGAGLWMYGREKELLFEIDGVKISAVSGNVLRCYGCEVIAIFNRYNLGAVSYESHKLLENLHNSEKGAFITKDDLPGNCRALYFRETHENVFDGKKLFAEVENILVNLLDALSTNGYKSVSMNGIRTCGYSELDNIRIIFNWIRNTPISSLKEIVLVDKDGGFNSLKNNVDFKMMLTTK